ncbi:MAG: 4Fe-4S dicluster domain-containing protein, partial [Clostridia bacterium]|nr:4Fe-4S dicluster domain-containing protein [Clostridia bacterium]
MSIIQFKEANCKNCYKCIRSCPVKAIAFVNDQARIVDEDCMLCGSCLTACPQNAKNVNSEVPAVKGFIRKKEKVYVSLAPSFVSAFEDTDERWLYAALKKLGFTFVEETAVGAAQVSKEYDRLIRENTMKNIITTACPSIALLVERYYPELIDQLAPVVSPAIAHGKILRQMYGSRIRVVFIGPCLSKKYERRELQNSGVIDAVLTFEELEAWLKEEGIDRTNALSEDLKGARELKARIYPAPGGVLKTLENTKSKNYQFISVDGVE